MSKDTEKFLQMLRKGVETERALPTPVARRQLRRAAGVTQEKAAKMLGVKRGTFAWWELGRHTPNKTMVNKYADLLEAFRQFIKESMRAQRALTPFRSRDKPRG